MVNWGMMAAIVFLSVNVSLFIVSLAFEYNNEVAITEWLWEAWTKRQAMAAPVLSAVYDTGTDLGVMILWHEMMRSEKKPDGGVQHIDMEVFFGLGVAFMALPRVVAALGLLSIGQFSKAAVVLVFFDFLWLFDIYKMKGKDTDFKATMTLKLVEALCESIPQMVLQCIFLVLTSDASQLGAVDYVLMVASMIASAASIAHILVWADSHQTLFEETTTTNETLMFVWRFCQVVTRLCVFSLLYATVGPIFLPVYYLLSLCAFRVFFKPRNWAEFATFLVSPITILHDYKYLSSIAPAQAFRRYDNFLALVIIAIFMFIGFDCVVCADSSFRTRNPFAEGLFFAAFICYVAEMVLFASLLPVVSDKYLTSSGELQTATGAQVAGATQLTATPQPTTHRKDPV